MNFTLCPLTSFEDIISTINRADNFFFCLPTYGVMDESQ